MSTKPPAPTAQISYSLLEDRSGDHKYFRIDPELGFIYTQSVFDRETKSSYLLEVQSVDGWESARPGKHGQPNSGKRGPAILSRVASAAITLMILHFLLSGSKRPNVHITNCEGVTAV